MLTCWFVTLSTKVAISNHVTEHKWDWPQASQHCWAWPWHHIPMQSVICFITGPMNMLMGSLRAHLHVRMSTGRKGCTATTVQWSMHVVY